MFKNVDLLNQRETHMVEGKSKQLQILGIIIDFIGHNKHVKATYVNEQIDQRLITKVEDNDYSINIKVGIRTIYNVNKPSFSIRVIECYQSVNIREYL